MEDKIKEAKELIAQEEQKAIEAAGNELQELLNAWREKHGCDIVISGSFNGNQVQSGIQIVKVK